MWQERDYFFQAASLESDENLAVIYDRTCRCDLSQPGFALINFGKDCESRQLRQQILLLTNSNAAFVEGGKDWLGVLHTAEIVNPMPEAKRVVNSTMIASVAMSAEDVLPPSEQEDFVVTDLVRGAAYN